MSRSEHLDRLVSLLRAAEVEILPERLLATDPPQKRDVRTAVACLRASIDEIEQELALDDEPRAVSESPLDHEPLRVLVVDDSRTAIEAARRELGDRGLVVRAALGTDEGLRLARELAAEKKLHVVLCDLVMLRRAGTSDGGVHLCRTLRDDPATARIPVVLWTATSRSAFSRLAAESGARGAVSKDADAEELVRVLRAACGRP